MQLNGAAIAKAIVGSMLPFGEAIGRVDAGRLVVNIEKPDDSREKNKRDVPSKERTL